MPEESGSDERREDVPKRESSKRKRKASDKPKSKRGRKRKPKRRRQPEPVVRRAAGEPGPARLYALLAGAGLALLGVVGFFYDAGFATGAGLDGDDVAGILIVNGWRNSIYLLSGLLALAFAASRPRTTSLGLAVLYLGLGIAGAANTNADIGSLFDALPLTNEDNVLHIVIGVLGLLALWADGPLPRPSRKRQGRRRPAPS